MNQLVSILIPAYNSAVWIADSLRSAIGQTWGHKEVIVLDDGSTDGTADVARAFESKTVKVVSKVNEGAAATRNQLLEMSQGRYIQWLDADDLLSPGKVERQMRSLMERGDSRTLLSCPWAYFYYRPHAACFKPTPLWEDLTPAEWLLRKMGRNLHQQTATWLTSRELVEAAGLWNEELLSDDDGEYFARVLMASTGTLFVPDARVYYRAVPGSRLSYIGKSQRKMDSMLVSMRLHLKYLLSLEDSPRSRQACINYLHVWSEAFDPRRRDYIEEFARIAESIGGRFDVPPLRWKYRWLSPIVGRTRAWHIQRLLPQLKLRAVSEWDRLMCGLQAGPPPHTRAVDG